jgi:hypothetical protein
MILFQKSLAPCDVGLVGHSSWASPNSPAPMLEPAMFSKADQFRQPTPLGVVVPLNIQAPHMSTGVLLTRLASNTRDMTTLVAGPMIERKWSPISSSW